MILFFLFVGLGYRPMPSSEDNVLSSLIYYQGTNNDSFRFWVDGLTEFLNGKNGKIVLQRVLALSYEKCWNELRFRFKL